MWNYSQSTGCMQGGGPKLIAFGYAGRDENGIHGKNNPDAQNIKGIGPLPRGKYKMVKVWEKHPTVGLFAIELRPDPANEMFGRSSFFVHGDSKEHPGLASHGCIILPPAIRRAMWYSGDHDLEVIQ